MPLSLPPPKLTRTHVLLRCSLRSWRELVLNLPMPYVDISLPSLLEALIFRQTEIIAVQKVVFNQSFSFICK